MNTRIIRYLQVSLFVLDMVVIYFVFFTTHFLFKEAPLSNIHKEYIQPWLYFCISWLLISFISIFYQGKYITSFPGFIKKSIKGITYFIVLIVCYLVFFRKSAIVQTFSVRVFFIPVALLLNRALFVLVYLYLKNKNLFLDRVVVIGYNDLAKNLIHTLEQNTINKEIVGICDDLENVNELHHYPIIGNMSNAIEACKMYGATEIYSSIAPEQNPNIYKLIELADESCIHFHIIPDTSVFINRQCYLNSINRMPVISLRHEPLQQLSNRIKKNVFDISFSLLVVVFILSWLIPVIGLLIRLDSKGPIFFKQMRSGKGNKKFACIKFRSMKVNGMAHEVQATKNDQRLTGIGKFLRHTNLDEFPQFLNVLKGDMSIVGPRPHMLQHTTQYSKVVDQYMVRHFLKPGITGWAQVNGYRGEINSFEKLKKRIEHDLWYLENWSMWLDLKIIVMTIFSTIKGDKNAF